MGRRRQSETEDGRGSERPSRSLAKSRTDRHGSAAWMYFVEQMTQNEIADMLGVGRVTIVRMLAEARARNEVKITIRANCRNRSGWSALERTFGLQRRWWRRLPPQCRSDTGDQRQDRQLPVRHDESPACASASAGAGRCSQACPSSAPSRSPTSKVISLFGGVGVARQPSRVRLALRPNLPGRRLF